MKLQQTNTQLEIKSSAYSQAIIGTIFLVGGLVAASLIAAGVFKDSAGKSLPIWLAAVGLVASIIGFFVVRSSKNKTVLLNRGGTSSVELKRIFGGKTENTTFETSRIKAVKLQTYLDSNQDSDGHNRTTRRSTLSLVLDNNDEIQLADEASKGGSFSINSIDVSSLISKAPLGKEAGQIADYLQVELQSVDMSNPAQAVKAVMDAFKQPQQPQAQQQPANTETLQR
jgi:hypothetical protein